MPIRKTRINVDLPLYDALWRLHPRIKRRFPAEYSFEGEGVNALGVMFVRPSGLRTGNNGGYWCSPTNTVAFAWTGGDGVHFSFLVRKMRIDSNSPVVVTAPSNSGNTNKILARNFQAFMRMGLRRGFFGLEQFAYGPQHALEVYGKPNWQPSEKWHYSVGFVPNERQVKVLAFAATSLLLRPNCCSAEAFANLQRRWMSLLQMSDEYYEVTGERR